MKWINAKERLPEELNVVLVHGENENEYYKGFGVAWLSHGRWTGNIHPVTHWMELPEAPEINEANEHTAVNHDAKHGTNKERISLYEKNRRAVYATGNKWAIENFNATH